MRTIKVELVVPVQQANAGLAGIFGGGASIRVSTEAVVDDESAREAGEEACSVLAEFMAGYGEAAE